MKNVSVGIKNELTNYRIMELSHTELLKYISLNNIFCQNQLFISSIEVSMIVLLLYRNGILFGTDFLVHRLFFQLAIEFMCFHYVIAICKNCYSIVVYSFIVVALLAPFIQSLPSFSTDHLFPFFYLCYYHSFLLLFFDSFLCDSCSAIYNTVNKLMLIQYRH